MSSARPTAQHGTLLLKTSSVDDASSFAEFERRLKEKERDLELAANIGKSLLDQNRELQERNEFLEESLNTSNDAVQQLKYQLQQRSDLLATFAEYEQQEFNNAHVQELHPSFISKLENRVKQLQTENTRLKDELTQLRDSNDEKQEKRVRNYLSQLQNANLKIIELQAQFAEKSKECCKQENELQRLIKEVNRRKEREKMISQENFDLQAELSEAVQNHEELRSEIESLQEKYTDILVVLNETQDELKTVRLETAHKTISLNSLYDSLASELEASDSGFTSTPLTSARDDLKQKELSSPTNVLQLELERLNRNSSPIEEMLNCQHEEDDFEPSTSLEALKLDMSTLTESSSNEYYDVPSKVILNAVKRSISADERRRAQSALHTPRSSTSNTTSHLSQNKTPFSHDISPRNTCQHTRGTFKKESADEDGKLTIKINETVANSPSPAISQTHYDKTYRNASCSPIRIETPPDEPTPREPCAEANAVFISYSGATSYMPNSSEDTTSHMFSSSSPSSSSEDENETAQNATDLLQNYAGPKFGQPGSPGSRDLEFSLHKMRLHKKLTQQYTAFRQRRGLEPHRVQMRTGRAGNSVLTNKNGLASLADRVGVVAFSNQSPSLSDLPSRHLPSQIADTYNDRQTAHRLFANDCTRLNGQTLARPKVLNRSASVGLQLWQHSSQHKHQTPRGIDNAIQDQMPLVCGVLWRSVTPQRQPAENGSNARLPSVSRQNTDKGIFGVQDRLVELTNSSSLQFVNDIRLPSDGQYLKPTSIEYLKKFFGLRHDSTNSEDSTESPLDQNGLGSILRPTTNNNDTIVQRSLLNGHPNF